MRRRVVLLVCRLPKADTHRGSLPAPYFKQSTPRSNRQPGAATTPANAFSAPAGLVSLAKMPVPGRRRQRTKTGRVCSCGQGHEAICGPCKRPRSHQGTDERLQIRLDLVVMETINIYEAKTRLSQLVDQAASGQDVVVSRNGKPLVRITRLVEPRRVINFGLLQGKLVVPADFDAPLPAEVLAAFEGL